MRALSRSSWTHRATRAALWLPLGAALAASAWQALQVRSAAAIGRRAAASTVAFEQGPPSAAVTVLVLGDSTGVGVGAHSPRHSLVGLLALDFPRARIVNRCRNGARVADLAEQFADLKARGERFDLVLVLAGGNDVLRLTPPGLLLDAARGTLRALRGLASTVVWLGSANVGASPRLLRPLAWYAERQTAQRVRLLAQAAREQDVAFIDFFQRRRDDLFAADPGRYFAADGIHPSSASYAHCYQALRRIARLGERLGAARPAGTPPED